MPESKLSAHFIVHRDYSHIRAAIASFAATTHTAYQLFVTINVPEPNQVEELQAAYPDVHFIINDRPQGFAANHNRILQQAAAPYIALLNDDIILQPHALDTLVGYLDAHPQVGVAGPQLRYPDGTLQVSAYSDPSFIRMIYKISGLARLTHQRSKLRSWLQRWGINRFLRLQSMRTYTEPSDVPIVKGAVMMVRQQAYTEVGPMDETTQAYGEEVDWHWRMREQGWKVTLVPEAQVIHYGQGQAVLNLQGATLLEDRKAILNYWIKHRPGWQVILLRLWIALTHGIGALVWLPLNRERAGIHSKAVILGLFWQRP